MIELAKDRWFPVVNVALAMSAALLWYSSSGSFGWPLLVAILVPWGVRVAAGLAPYRYSRFDGWIILFGMTAVLGTFTAYNSELAQGKFWILVGAIAGYFAIVSVSRRDVWLLAGATGPLGMLLTLYFVMSNNWQQWPADIGLLNRVGLFWMSIRPSFGFPVLHPNSLAGMMALLFPFIIAFALYAWQRKQIRWLQLAVVSGLVTAGGLVFTSSLGAWSALAIGLSVWGLWVASGWLCRQTPLSQKTLFTGLSILLLLGSFFLFRLLFGSAAGLEDSETRLGLARQTLYLIQDFSLTGSGLASFPGLYSQYVQGIPQFFVAYSNLYLDVWLELGLFGLLALVALLLGSFWMLFKRSGFMKLSPKTDVTEPDAETILTTAPSRRRRRSKNLVAEELVWFQWAAFVSLLVMVLHGFLDDALFGNLASPLLFFAPAMVVVVTRRQSDPAAPRAVRRKRWAIGMAATAVLLVGLFFGFRQEMQGQWHANLGALALAQAELVNWPTNQWDRGDDLDRFDDATARLERTLAIDPQNRTAHHRLGLIAMVARDYETAVFHLEQASIQAEQHRGLSKSLGYSYVWLGEFNKARQSLTQISEARAEMAIYRSWWERQNRPDLAIKADEMISNLENATLSNP